MLWKNRCVCPTKEKVTKPTLNERKIRNFVMKTVALFRAWVLAWFSENTHFGKAPRRLLQLDPLNASTGERFGTWINHVPAAEITGRLVVGERRRQKGTYLLGMTNEKLKPKGNIKIQRQFWGYFWLDRTLSEVRDRLCPKKTSQRSVLREGKLSNQWENNNQGQFIRRDPCFRRGGWDLDESTSSEVATKALSKKLPKCGLKKQTLRPFCWGCSHFMLFHWCYPGLTTKNIQDQSSVRKT